MTNHPRNHHRLRPRNSVFARWITTTGLNLTAIASVLGCSIQAISNFRGGHSKPGRELANRIAEVSKGAVPADSWDRKPRRVKVAA